jgi:hypothetical protein
MSASKTHILYKIYYGDTLVYLGRTNQPLQTRLRGHFFKKPMHRTIDISQVSRIEYAEFPTEADMFLYEVYYINKLKPPLNVDDRALDDLTVSLPEKIFEEFDCHLMDKWKIELDVQKNDWSRIVEEYKEIPEKMSILRMQRKTKDITEEEFQKQYDKLVERKEELHKKIYG